MSSPQAPLLSPVKSHFPKVHRQQTSQKGMYRGLYFSRSLKSHSLRSVDCGNGVGPTGSVHVSSKILPKDNSRSFITPISVLSSLIFTCAAFLDKDDARLAILDQPISPRSYLILLGTNKITKTQAIIVKFSSLCYLALVY